MIRVIYKYRPNTDEKLKNAKHLAGITNIQSYWMGRKFTHKPITETEFWFTTDDGEDLTFDALRIRKDILKDYLVNVLGYSEDNVLVRHGNDRYKFNHLLLDMDEEDYQYFKLQKTLLGDDEEE